MKLSCTKYMLFLAVALLLLGAAACTQSKPVVPSPTLPALQTPLLPQAVSTDTPAAQGTAPAAVATQPAAGTPAPGLLATPTPFGVGPQAQPTAPAAGETQVAPPVAQETPAGGSVQPATGACSNPYIVQRGEWLYSIARKCGVSAGAIIAANPRVNLNLLYPGQSLVMPSGGATQGGGTTTGGGRTYVVQPGDTLFRIAQRFGVSVQALMAANGLSNPNFIFAGQVLTIP